MTKRIEKRGRERRRRWQERLAGARKLVESQAPEPLVEGVLRRVIGLTIEAVGCRAPVGSHCRVETVGGEDVDAEVVGFAGDSVYLMPTTKVEGLVPNARVIPTGKTTRIPVGDNLLGRVLDGTARPLDGGPTPQCHDRVSLTGRPINPLQRHPIEEPMDVGIRSINGLLTVGRGQRMGLFAGSGVGKSVLLGMMTRFTEADVIVVGLIGERGREVNDFVQQTLGEEGMRRSVVVASPADNPPLMRLQGAWLATRIAEYYRDRGRNVLLLMDSLTRFAQAQREIALSIGEPPATKGYPPSVFAKLPQLVERAGNGDSGGGSITAFYTVLVEGDDQSEPVADASRAILDGHLVLSRDIAESGMYPAIDVEASVSRAMTAITEEQHQEWVRRFRHLYSLYRQNQDLISVGAYRRGNDPRLDEAVNYWPRIQQYLRQDMNERVSFDGSLEALEELLAPRQEASQKARVETGERPRARGNQAARAYEAGG